ncbi:MAG: hypothetical protein ACYTG0_08620 [Planctomycetota bacterium]|jgi:hypothetical protein
MTCRYKIAFLAAFGISVGCSSEGDLYPEHEPKWSAEPARAQLPDCGESTANVEFSSDGSLLCVRWLSSGRNGTGPPLRLVFDLVGRPVTEVIGPGGLFAEGCLERFPASVPRTSTPWGWYVLESLKTYTGFKEFLKDAGGWGFSRDFTLALRLVNPRTPGGKPVVLPSGGRKVWSAELWRLAPAKQRVWGVDLPPRIVRLALADFFQRGEKRYVLVAFDGDTAHVLSQDDGALVSTFTYGHIETREEMAARRGKFNLDSEPFDVDMKFSPHEFSFDPKRGLLACGSFHDRRVPIVSVDSPGRPCSKRTRMTTHTSLPGGAGWWSVSSLPQEAST